MTKKYQLLIKKIEKLQANPGSNHDFSQEEWELIEEALTTIQFLEIVFKVRKQSARKSWTTSLNYHF